MSRWTNSLMKFSVQTPALLVAFAMLAGCESKVSVELETQAPADLRIRNVDVLLRGVEFEKSDGNVETLEFDDSQAVNLMAYLDGNSFRIFTDEQLPDGRYTGVRLLFDTDEDNDEVNRVVLIDGREFDLAVGTNDFTDVDFTVDKDESSSDGVTLTLDLRQSLPFDDDENSTTLTPIVRAIRDEDAGGIAGNVAVSCPADSSLALYLFSGTAVTPDDVDKSAVEPYLTTAVGRSGTSSNSGYAFSFLPAGDYTLASTCRGNEENPTSSEDLDFRNVTNVDVEAEATTTRNIP